MTDVLIIFSKNLILGKVKSRIAREFGEDAAFNVHKILVDKTLQTIAQLPETIHLVFYFSENIEKLRSNAMERIRVEVQEGKDLGERMSNAIKSEKEKGGGRICLIGTDIFDLSKEIILEAFKQLTHYQVIIGPAFDGGYYLIGMKQNLPELFSDIKWGRSTVVQVTITRLNKYGIKYYMLKTLNDVDEYKDIPEEVLRQLDL